jgi:hypothetical protein
MEQDRWCCVVADGRNMLGADLQRRHRGALLVAGPIVGGLGCRHHTSIQPKEKEKENMDNMLGFNLSMLFNNSLYALDSTLFCGSTKPLAQVPLGAPRRVQQQTALHETLTEPPAQRLLDQSV